ncbi:MAG: nucleoside-diphosphate kinase [Euryarchaeota archaeon]|nr:nucleoside-diphosphate kinase [Euryarchaeota archaeon]
MERSFFMVKPDGVERGLVGEIISRVEKKGLKIIAMKMIRVDANLAKKHYAEHAAKPFFRDLVAYITSGPCVAMVVEGNNAIKTLRDMTGKTNPKEAAAGTIRGDFGIDVCRNVVHASDSKESAKKEIELFFRPSEIL